MGYGGALKKVVRIAVPVAVSLMGGGPLAVALSSAAATGATGGSFKESLMAAGTSYIGASVGQSVSAGASLEGMPTTYIDSSGVTQVAAGGTVPAGFSGAGEALSGTIQGGLAGGLGQLAANANKAVEGGVSQFTGNVDLGFGGIQEGGKTFFRSAADVLNQIGDTALMPGMGNELVKSGSSTLIGDLVGGATALTLEQGLAYGDKLAEQQLLDQGYSPEQIRYLAQEARNRLAGGAFERTLSSVDNPFIRTGQSEEQRLAAENEFKKVIASGIEKKNTALGRNVTQQQWNTVFDDPSLGQNILEEEQNLRRSKFSQDVGNLFTGKAFEPLDNSEMINNIVSDQVGPAYNQIANVEARGNLNVLGGKTARNYITSQQDAAKERVGSLTSQLLGESQRDIDEIRGQATQAAQSYKLGDELFDISPFKEQRQGIIDTRTQSLETGVRDLLGTEQLFDPRTAVQRAGSAQGLVSGPSNPNLLDQLAARVGASRRNQRGLGTRGSGVF